MSDFGLEKSELEFVLKILRESLPAGTSFYIFGSRAKGNFKKFSDVDIAIDFAGSRLDADVVQNIAAIFSGSLFPYEVDIVDLNAINENFRSIISKSLVKFG